MEQRPFPCFEISIESKDDMNRTVLPNVLLIVVKKASMMSIANWLFKTDVCGPQTFDDKSSYYNKEAHFFNERDCHKQGIKFYAKQFQHCADEENFQFVMDVTPKYILYSEHMYEKQQSAGEPIVYSQHHTQKLGRHLGRNRTCPTRVQFFFNVPFFASRIRPS